MSKSIGPREQALRDLRERLASRRPVALPSDKELAAGLAAKLPATSGKMPVKRKAKKRAKR